MDPPLKMEGEAVLPPSVEEVLLEPAEGEVVADFP